MGWSYRRVGALEPVLAANLRWLAGYRHPRCLNPDYSFALLRAFARPGPLLATAERVGDRIAVLPTVFHLLWTGTLTADLSGERLAGTTLVGVRGGEG